jgi:DNA-binding CsgD family transcriptional regulator
VGFAQLAPVGDLLDRLVVQAQFHAPFVHVATAVAAGHPGDLARREQHAAASGWSTPMPRNCCAWPTPTPPRDGPCSRRRLASKPRCIAAGGDSSDARRHLDVALERYGALDAHWDTARASARLRPYGIRRGAHGQRGRPKTGWTALTPTEQKIAEFVSGGMSNPDIAARTFTSRRTVQFHVSNILTKLGLTSRVELAALVARQSR